MIKPVYDTTHNLVKKKPTINNKDLSDSGLNNKMTPELINQRLINNKTILDKVFPINTTENIKINEFLKKIIDEYTIEKSNVILKFLEPSCHSKYPLLEITLESDKNTKVLYFGKKKDKETSYYGKLEFRHNLFSTTSCGYSMEKTQGVITYKNEAIYEGEVVNGQANGKGVITYKNGTIYEGEVVNGKANGEGVITYKNVTNFNLNDRVVNYLLPYSIPKDVKNICLMNKKSLNIVKGSKLQGTRNYVAKLGSTEIRMYFKKNKNLLENQDTFIQQVVKFILIAESILEIDDDSSFLVNIVKTRDLKRKDEEKALKNIAVHMKTICKEIEKQNISKDSKSRDSLFLEYGLYFEFINRHISEGNEFINKKISEEIQKCGTLLKFNSNSYISSEDFVLKNILGKLENNFDFMLEVVRRDPFKILYASTDLKNNSDFMLEVFRIDSSKIDNASCDLKNNSKFMLEVIGIDSSKIDYASYDLKNNSDFMLEVFRIDSSKINKASCELKNNSKFMLEVIGIDSSKILYASDDLKNNFDFMLEVFRIAPSKIAHASNDLKNNLYFIFRLYIIKVS